MYKKIKFVKCIKGNILETKIITKLKKIDGQQESYKELRIMPRLKLYKKAPNLSYVEKIIAELTKDGHIKYIVPIFLLKIQKVEVLLQFLLEEYPFHIKKINKEKINKLTLGQLVEGLRNQKDSYLEDIINNIDQLNELRIKFVHNLLKLEKFNPRSLDDYHINSLIEELENKILYYFDFVEQHSFS